MTKTLTSNSESWENVLDDYLELKASLKPDARSHLIGQLKKLGFQHFEIEPLYAFAISGHQILVRHKVAEHVSWFYDPKRKTLRRMEEL